MTPRTSIALQLVLEHLSAAHPTLVDPFCGCGRPVGLNNLEPTLLPEDAGERETFPFFGLNARHAAFAEWTNAADRKHNQAADAEIILNPPRHAIDLRDAYTTFYKPITDHLDGKESTFDFVSVDIGHQRNRTAAVVVRVTDWTPAARRFLKDRDAGGERDLKHIRCLTVLYTQKYLPLYLGHVMTERRHFYKYDVLDGFSTNDSKIVACLRALCERHQTPYIVYDVGGLLPPDADSGLFKGLAEAGLMPVPISPQRGWRPNFSALPLRMSKTAMAEDLRRMLLSGRITVQPGDEGRYVELVKRIADQLATRPAKRDGNAFAFPKTGAEQYDELDALNFAIGFGEEVLASGRWPEILRLVKKQRKKVLSYAQPRRYRIPWHRKLREAILEPGWVAPGRQLNLFPIPTV